jgi:hypothetical protein
MEKFEIENTLKLKIYNVGISVAFTEWSKGSVSNTNAEMLRGFESRRCHTLLHNFNLLWLN